MSFNQDPNAPDFAAIYSTTQPVQTADLTTELAEIGVTSLTGLSDVQLQEIATRLDAHRAQKLTQQAAATQAQSGAVSAQTTAMDAQTQYYQAQTAALTAQTAALTKPAEKGLDPAAWLAYLQKVGAEGYGGDPADYANAIYDAHYQVAQAGKTGEQAAAPSSAAAAAPAAPKPAAVTTAQMLAAIAKRSPGANTAQVQNTLNNDLAKGYTPEHILAGPGGGAAAQTAPIAQPAAQPAAQPVTQPAAQPAAPPVAQSAQSATPPITQPAPMTLTQFNAANRAGVISRAGAAGIDYNTQTVNQTVQNNYDKYLAGLPK